MAEIGFEILTIWNNFTDFLALIDWRDFLAGLGIGICIMAYIWADHTKKKKEAEENDD